ncbi:TetR/AcrR family transcriptional regulator [Sinomonas sp.]|jgi:AcrR family transcriptional regulator|uniref:TetR/AcrR family transcriptional regulator n=1 Tax=Sinomonas sp. TaxID=1914986 RepID=UPI002FE3E9F3
MDAVQKDKDRPGVRERVLAAAFELYATKGVRETGIEELLARSEVAKASFYRHFASKDELGLAYLERLYLERREELAAAVRAAGEGPMAVLGVFDVYAELFRAHVPEARSFIHVLMELGPEHRLGKACIHYSALLQEDLARFADERGIPDPVGFAAELQTVIKGAIVSSAEGDGTAAELGRRLGRLVVEAHLRQA